MQLLLLTCAIVALLPLSYASRCPLTGPVLSRPKHLSDSSLVKSAGTKLQQKISAVLSDEKLAGWDVKNTSFSLALISASSNKPIWQYHHLAKANTKGTKSVDGDSQYLIGSISKVFTDLLLYKSGVDPNDPVTKYLPELKGNNTEVQWDEVTLEGLADHLSGIRMNSGYPEIYQVVPLFEQLGFPKLSKSDFPPCGIIGLNKGCTRQQLLDLMRDSHPVSAPNLRPVYSSISFSVLAYALQSATGKSFEKLLQEEITSPLKLMNTGASPGKTPRAVVPPGESSWGANYGPNAPGGGLYSSINDLTKFASAILNHSPKILSSTSSVRKWLLPHSVVATDSSLVGAPWEFYRSNDAGLFPSNVEPRTLTIAAKDGSALSYSARLALLDEYGIGFAILTAGAKGSTAVNILGEALLATFLPTIEEEARREGLIYTGKFMASDNDPVCGKSAEHDGDGIIPANGTIKLDMDNGPGLRLAALKRDGADMIDGMRTIYNSQPVFTGHLDPDLRLYPSEVQRVDSITIPDEKGQRCTKIEIIEEDWRLLFEAKPIAPRSNLANVGNPGLGVFESWCGSFQLQDSLYYGGEPIDRFVFLRRKASNGDAGEIIGIKIPALRMVFWQ